MKATYVYVIALGIALIVSANGNENEPHPSDEKEFLDTDVGVSSEVEPITNTSPSKKNGKVGEDDSNDNPDSDTFSSAKEPKGERNHGSQQNKNKRRKNQNKPKARSTTTEVSITESPEIEKKSTSKDEENSNIEKGNDNLTEFVRTDFWDPESPVSTRLTVEDSLEVKNTTCTSPPEIGDAVTSHLGSTEHALGETVIYRCNFGYVSRNSASHTSICHFNEATGKAEWTIPDIECIPRSCGDPGYVTNGRRIGNLFTFPNKVEFQCEEGFKLRGLRARYCQAGGEWSGRLPTCEQIYCSVPSDPLNGRVRYSSLEYGTELRYECNAGFMLKNDQPRFCSGGGTWSSDQPECIEAKCDMPENPEYGTVKLSGDLKVGSLLRYFCNDGKTLYGSSTSKCLITGEWTFPPPKCLNACYIPAIENGDMGRFRTQQITRYKTEEVFVKAYETERVGHNERLFLRCNTDFLPMEDSTTFSSDNRLEVTCNDGTWSKVLQCKITSCLGEPPEIDNGSPVVSSRANGVTIWYRCQPGFSKKKGNVTCHFGSWMGDPPRCHDTRCSTNQLNYPGLQKPQSEFFSSKSFTVVCEKGYRKIPRFRTISCYNGQWDIRQNPCSEESCSGEPPAIKNGNPRKFERQPGSEIQYECNEDFNIVGRSTVRCQLGRWEGNPPVCVKYSEQDRSSEVQLEGASTTAPLKEVFKLVTQNTSVIQPLECFCTYDNENPFVTVKLGDKILQRGDKVGRGETVSLKCNYDYMALLWSNGLRLYGAANFSCTTCQPWEGKDFPICTNTRISDSLIESNSKLKILPGGFAEIPKGDVVRFFCRNYWKQPQWDHGSRPVKLHTGYNFDSSRVKFHLTYMDIVGTEDKHNGRYECFVESSRNTRTGVSTLDIRVTDSAPPENQCHVLSDNNGMLKIVYDNDRKVNSAARYTCADSSKKLEGNSVRKCLNDGKWSGSFPTCVVFNDHCPQIDGQGIFEIYYDEERKINSKAHFHCKEHGKEVEGSRFVICLSNGSWSGGYPTCVELNDHCPQIDGQGIFEIYYDNQRKINSKAHFHCKEHGKKVEGSRFVLCLWNKSWSGVYPTCVDYMACSKFEASSDLTVAYSHEGDVNSIATFSCRHHNNLVGHSYAICRSNGTWSYPLPSCEAPSCSVGDLSTSLPENVIPDERDFTAEHMPSGSEVRLKCEPNFILNVDSAKAVCGNLGKWEFGAFQCVPGCHSTKDASSSVVMQPMKEGYRFGELVVLSCPPGLQLSSDVERVMCLGKSWSNPMPDCIEPIRR